MKFKGLDKLHRPFRVKRVPVTLLFNPTKNKDKLTRAYALVTKVRVLSINCLLTPSTGTRVLELANRLSIPVKELIDSSSQIYKELSAHDMSDEDWAKILVKQPSLLKTPIIIKGNKAHILNRPKDIFKI